jgi:hypothetical protein
MRRRRRQDEAADDADEADEAPETEDAEEATDEVPPGDEPPPSLAATPSQPSSYAVPGIDGTTQSPTPLITVSGNATAQPPPPEGPNLAVIICGFYLIAKASCAHIHRSCYSRIRGPWLPLHHLALMYSAHPRRETSNAESRPPTSKSTVSRNAATAGPAPVYKGNG